MCVARLFARIQCTHTIRILNTVSRSRPRGRDGEAGDFDGVPGATGTGPAPVGAELCAYGPQNTFNANATGNTILPHTTTKPHKKR